MFVKLPTGTSLWLDNVSTTTEVVDVLQLSDEADHLYFQQNGKLVTDPNSTLNPAATLHVSGRLVGGKGGFGSMLRSIGAQIERTTNHEAMRDLSGRRQRDVNNEKRLKKYIEGQAEREREAEEKREKKIEKLKKLVSGENKPKHDFSDPVYDKVRSETEEKVHSAMEAAMAVAGSSKSSDKEELKRKSSEVPGGSGAKKPKGLWIGDGLEGLSDLEDSEDDSDDEEDKKQKGQPIAQAVK